ncbi:AMP-binding protein [Cytobacillus purgationiresistens]|uniref:Crotonobetaine/carnitine-CoA ligase n=1 Tax=Cytobacillus purgationiresistens TaxID=863449 RepID=A0ABU0ANN1_9BACI|nr:AMP-binding protein [Cytobacillus purgationiresistens]MDQ0272640.1 crotonobetaine/carnitine-CoA ligase [Cytobacillus purgationiresistens]
MNTDVLLNEMGVKEEVVTKCIEHWANVSGEKLFLYYGESGKKLTYWQFNQITNSIGHSLMEKGIKKGDRISVFLKNPFITTMVMFGIWKCGAIFSPINFNYRGKLLSYQLIDTEPQLLITERAMVPILNEISSEIQGLQAAVHNSLEGDHDYIAEIAELPLNQNFIEFPFERLMQGPTNNLNVEINYWDTANIIYTSGTTGPAKGVVQSHRWINGYTLRMRLFMTQADVVYNDLPLYHVGGAFANIAKAAYSGCTVAIWDKFSPKQFWNRIETCGASMAILLDVMIPWLVNAQPSENDRMNTLNKVHMQPLPKYHHEVAKRFGIDIVSAGFGQTESGNPLAGMIIELEPGKGSPEHFKKGMERHEILERCNTFQIPVIEGNKKLDKGFMGKPTKFFEVAVLDNQDLEVSAGKVGQIAFRPKLPHLIMSEYFNKPNSTTKAFKNLWFHTGDAGYLGEDGYYYFVDRLGGVIRSRGEKISSYQLEDIITSHSEIDFCAAFPVPAEEGDEDDVAIYVVKKANSEIDEEELSEWAEGQMPKYMWPKYIRFTVDLPRTPTNKVEKYKLRDELLQELTAIRENQSSLQI